MPNGECHTGGGRGWKNRCIGKRQKASKEEIDREREETKDRI